MSSEVSPPRRKADVIAIFVIGIAGLVLLYNVTGFMRHDRNHAGIGCSRNQRNLALAVTSYNVSVGHLPGFVSTNSVGKRFGWPAVLFHHLEIGQSESRNVVGGSLGSYLREMVCPENRFNELNAPYNSYIFNCGQPDASLDPRNPPDWKANGAFFDHSPEQRIVVLVDLDYIQDHDGLSTTLMLSENIDAGMWTATHEAEIGFVWSTADLEYP